MVGRRERWKGEMVDGNWEGKEAGRRKRWWVAGRVGG